jgi:predicted PolB exonuclease-like 3'-5' exonuclease
LCLALSIPTPKGDLDGSKVWQYVQDGRHEEVAAYCRRDVEATRQVHRRMTFQTVDVPEFEDVPA